MEGIIKIDENKLYMLLKTAMKIPGVRINREEFLKKELSKYVESGIIYKAINENPASANISIDIIDKIASSCINLETSEVSLTSVVAGIPGGLAVFGTASGDILQYFAHILRILQKLIYLYGWQDIYKINGDFDDKTLNIVILFMGTMFGVQSANAFTLKLARDISKNVERKIINNIYAKETIYPLARKIAGALGIKLSREVFGKAAAKIFPIVGGAVAGVFTYASFKPAAKRLQKHLRSLSIANPDYYNNRNYNNYNNRNYNNRYGYSANCNNYRQNNNVSYDNPNNKVIDVDFRECIRR